MRSVRAWSGSPISTQSCKATPPRASQPILMSTVRAGRLLHSLFQNRPVLTLERSVGKVAGADSSLWQSGLFRAGITPDLPVVSSWKEVVAKLLGRCRNTDFQVTCLRSAAEQHSHVQFYMHLCFGLQAMGSLRRDALKLDVVLCAGQSVHPK